MNGLRHTSALSGSIFSILLMPLSTLITSIFFKEERTQTKQIHFWLGSSLAVMGSFIFIVNGIHSSDNSNFIKGYSFLTVSIFIQTTQNLIIKKVAATIHPVIISTSTSLLSGLIYITIAVSTNTIAELAAAFTTLIISLGFTGIYGMITRMLMSIYII